MAGYDKQRLMAIKDFRFKVKLDEMGEDEYRTYLGYLDEFVNILPVKRAEVNEHFIRNEAQYFTESMIEVREILKKVHAGNLSSACLTVMSQMGKVTKGEMERRLEQFFSELYGVMDAVKDARVVGEESETQEEVAEEAAVEEVEPEAVEPEAVEPAEPVELEDTRKVVLVVDDVAMMLKVMENVIEDAGYRYVGFKTGQLALGYLAKHNPDLIILDINMPYMDGYELTRMIRKQGKEAPIFFVTGNKKKEFVRKAIQVGVKEFLVKPIDKEFVTNKMKKYLEEAKDDQVKSGLEERLEDESE